MKASIKRTFSLLVSLALLLGAMLIYSFLIKPEYDFVNELRGTVSAKSDLLTEQQSVISQVQDLLSQFQSSARIQESVSLALPLKEEESGIFAQLQALAQANGLTIEVFGVQGLPTKPTFVGRGKTSVVKDLGVLQANLKVSGGYENFKNFLQGVETNIRVMDLASLKIEKDGRVPGRFNYNLVVNAYYQTD